MLKQDFSSDKTITWNMVPAVRTVGGDLARPPRCPTLQHNPHMHKYPSQVHVSKNRIATGNSRRSVPSATPLLLIRSIFSAAWTRAQPSTPSTPPQNVPLPPRLTPIQSNPAIMAQRVRLYLVSHPRHGIRLSHLGPRSLILSSTATLSKQIIMI